MVNKKGKNTIIRHSFKFMVSFDVLIDGAEYDQDVSTKKVRNGLAAISKSELKDIVTFNGAGLAIRNLKIKEVS